MRRHHSLVARPNNRSDGKRVVRLAYVVHSFGTGGLERCVANLCNLLDRSRFRPMVICLDRNGVASDWIRASDVRIVELKKRPSNDPMVVFRLARVLRENRIDLVHSQNWGTLVETALARSLARVPVHVHAERGTLLGDLNEGSWRGRIRAVAARWAMNRAECVVTVAESVRERLLTRCGPLRRPVRVIANGVAVPKVTKSKAELAELRRSLGIPVEAALLGSVGRLVPVKGFENAIDALSQLRQDGRNVHLLLVGDGPERDRLAARARTQRIETCVHMVGRKDDVGNWLRMMDVYLNVSHSEGMSQSILEAMAIGLPMVVSDVGDSAAMVNGPSPCGLLVPPGEAGATAGAVAELLARRSLRGQFARSAHARHRTRYGIQGMVRAYERLYAELTDSGNLGFAHPALR